VLHILRDHVRVEEIFFNEEKVIVLTQSTEMINQSKKTKKVKKDGGK